MRVGATIFNQNYGDWDRYEAEERGEAVPPRPAKADREIFNEELNLARIADDTGFDSVWTIEHHFTPYTMVTNPLQYLTYVAGITKRVDLGTMVTVLPWHNPVRVAEDVNMLDTFLGPDREIICGVGRGLGRREYDGLSIDQAQARERFDESIQVLRELLATGRCDFHGKHFDIKGLRLRPQPDRDLSPNLWCAGGTDQTVEIIAKHDVRPLIVPTVSLDIALKTARRYQAIRAEHGLPAAATKLALWTYVAETEADARAGAEQYMVEYAESALRHYELLGDHLGGIKGYESYGEMQKMLRQDATPFLRGFFDSHPWGTPEQVVARASELAESFGTDELMFIFKYGGMPIEKAEKSMRLFAEAVLPELQKLAPQPMAQRAAA
ncbi:MAG: LLM class flavin-dependent oxidoreductase [Gammaproteobacteria bacterium]|nr:LLM class flavin-dependent oxidoreductase [Gammaproteobacteria bacterium]MCP5200896.1 LLM class flavin-dependent oxidoreductase [Gammaproteobacteria bacterium]